MIDVGQIIRGAVVYLDTTPGQFGVLTGRKMQLGPLTMAQVDWGGNTEHQSIEHLCLRDDSAAEDIPDLVRRGLYGTIEDLRRCMTYEKLQGTLTDVFYSMSAAQIDFLPHQFKPVCRFVDAPTNRLLIADEVGLGKTIEAGLIWLECQARHGARRLLVVCPAMLCLKWQRELREKFQLDVTLADVDRLTDLMDEFDRVGDRLTFHAICSYNALRPLKDERGILDAYAGGTDAASVGATEMSPRGRLLRRMMQGGDASPFANLVVFDEAAVMKNTATSTHTLGRILSAESAACVCLSATPVHNTSRDLYALLRLVDPEYFHSDFVFELLRNRNRPVVELCNRLASHPVDVPAVLRLVNAVAASDYFGPSAIVEQIRTLAQAPTLDPKTVATMAALGDRLNLLSTYICRTRKVQISTNGRVRRRSVTLSVDHTPEEAAFYRAVLQYIRKQVRLRGEIVTSLHTMAPALRMASCLPVMVSLLESGRWGGIDELVESEGAPDADSIPESTPGLLDATELAKDLTWIRTYDFEANDTKYRELHADLLGRVGKEKVVLFAFFKDTLKYLARRLSKDGFRVALLTGDLTDQQERETVIAGFETTSTQVLLCSEVAAEGIDLQFCHTLVNYDLPWNPMRVEQRIGRLDRIGQRAKAITIVNFHIHNTVDGLVYEHLYRKIGIFEHTIGALETILGPEIARMTSALLSADLSAEETAEQVDQVARAIETARLEQEDLEQSGNDLVAYADYLAEQVGNSQRLGRYVRPVETRLYLTGFFAKAYPGCRLDWDTPEADCGTLALSYQAADSLAAYARAENLPLPAGLAGGASHFTFALDPEVFARVRRRHRLIALVNHLHPLVKWVTRSIREKGWRLHQSAAVGVQDATVPPGQYFFLVRRLTLEGLHKREHLLYALVNLHTQEIWHGEAVEQLLNAILEHGENLFPGRVPDMTDALKVATHSLDDVCAATIAAYKDEMGIKSQVQVAQAKAHFARKIEITRKQIESMQLSAESRARGLALARTNLASYEKALARKLDELASRAAVRLSAADIGCGIVEVSAP